MMRNLTGSHLVNASLSNLTMMNETNEDIDNSELSNNNNNNTGPIMDPLISLRVPAIMFASGVFGNILAILFLVRSSREHKQTVFYRLVGALACTDLFGTCATSPVTLAVYANKMKWVGGSPLCNYESFMLVFASYSTIFIIGVMAVDRFISMSKPYFYEQYITIKEAHIAIVSLWIFAAIMGCLPIFGLGENIIQFPGTWCFFTFTSSEIKNKLFTYSYASIALLVVGVTAVSNVYVTFILLKMRRKAMKTMNFCSAQRNDSELQMMVLLLGIIIVFSTCWCPFMIRLLVNQTNESQVDVKADLFALRLASLNQILDPWIYILFRRELFARTFRFFRRIVHPVGTYLRACLNRQTGRRHDPLPEKSDSKHSEQLQPLSTGDGLYTQVERRDDVINGGLAEHSLSCSVPHEHHDFQTNHVTVRTPPVTYKIGNGRSPSCVSRDSYRSICSENLHRNSLNLKHQFCLFCMSNHAKHVVETTKNDNTHLEEKQEGSSKDDNTPKEEDSCTQSSAPDMTDYCTCNGLYQSFVNIKPVIMSDSVTVENNNDHV